MKLIIQPPVNISTVYQKYTLSFLSDETGSYINTSSASPLYLTINDKSTVSFIFSGSGFTEPTNPLPGSTVKLNINGLNTAESICAAFSSSLSSSLEGTIVNYGNSLYFTSTNNSYTAFPTSSFNQYILNAYVDEYGRAATNITGSATASYIELTGSLNISGSINLQSGSEFYVNGNKQFNYISLYHTGSISMTANTSGSFIYSNVDHSNGLYIASESRIYFQNSGIYNIQFSAQMYTPTNNTHVYIWFKKNGANISNSATLINHGSLDYGVAAWNYIYHFESGSYAEIAYQSNQNTTQFSYITASGNIPAIPSIIATISQVS